MRLLTFLVEERLAGPGEPLKEYRIALDVFGRPESFDPRSDSIVRIAARELRFKLREYYDTEGSEDPIRIELPKGSYLLEFILRTPVSPAPPTRRRRLWLLLAGCGALVLLGAAYFAIRNVPAGRATTVAVLPFETLSVAAEDNYLCQGLVDELTTALANVDGLRVVARTSATRLRESADLLAEARRIHWTR